MESARAKAASPNFGLNFLMIPPSRELARAFAKSRMLHGAKKPVSLAAASLSEWSKLGFGLVQRQGVRLGWGRMAGNRIAKIVAN
jgi:hypothetical protein